jgi:hypothetical protein
MEVEHQISRSTMVLLMAKAAIQPNDMQSEIDMTETSKGVPDGPREVVEPCMEEKKKNARPLTNQGFCPFRYLRNSGMITE